MKRRKKQKTKPHKARASAQLSLQPELPLTPSQPVVVTPSVEGVREALEALALRTAHELLQHPPQDPSLQIQLLTQLARATRPATAIQVNAGSHDTEPPRPQVIVLGDREIQFT
jgi:hypothetical protein